MPAEQQDTGRAAARAGGIATVILGLLLAARVADIPLDGEVGQASFALALFVLPLLTAIPRTRFLIERYPWPVLAVQAVLTWVPFVVFGRSWLVGIGGLLAGLVLLIVASPLSWWLAGGLLAAEVAVRAALIGLPPNTPPSLGVFWVVTYYVDDCLLFFGSVRLAQVIAGIERARRSAAGLAVSGERWRAAQSLQAAIGERLADVADLALSAQRCLARDAARAREQIAAAGAAAREATARARALLTARDARREDPEVHASAAVITTRLAWGVLIVTLSAYVAENLAYVANAHYSVRLAAFAYANIIVVAALQSRHSWATRHGRKPRWWPLTLTVQAVLVYAIVFPFVHAYVGGLAGFLAASGLLLIPGRWRWVWFAVVVTSWPILEVELSLRGYVVSSDKRVPALIFNAAALGTFSLMAYGLTRLSRAAVQLERLRTELSRLAQLQERLRISRDVHDLLGLGLYAIGLKSDLAVRLIGRDDARASVEIAELGRICAAARADLREVTEDGQRLSVAAELAAAGQILSSAGIELDADVPSRPLPEPADTVLAPVLREAVTNVLRHSSARCCSIQLAATDGGLRLRVSNDGAGATSTGRRSGRGLANLRERVHTAGGRMTSGQVGGRFDLVAEIPLPRPRASRAPRAAEAVSPVP